MKRRSPYLLLVGLLLSLCLTACHKTCVCYGYDEMVYSYSKEEVDARDGDCSNMVLQADTRFYSVCNWE